MEKGGRKKLIGGIIAAVAVVAVIVAVIIVATRQNDDKKTQVLSDAEQIEILEEVLDEVGSLSDQKVETYLDVQIEKYDGTSLEYDLRMLKVNVLQESGKTAEALAAAEEINPDDLEQKELLEYYMQLSILYYAAGNKEKGVYYNDLYKKLHVEIYGEMGGGR